MGYTVCNLPLIYSELPILLKVRKDWDMDSGSYWRKKKICLMHWKCAVMEKNKKLDIKYVWKYKPLKCTPKSQILEARNNWNIQREHQEELLKDRGLMLSIKQPFSVLIKTCIWLFQKSFKEHQLYSTRTDITKAQVILQMSLYYLILWNEVDNIQNQY